MNIASMVSSYNRSQKRKSVISSDDSLISASDLSKEWGLSYIATCEEIKRLRIPLAFNIANEKFYDMETCNKKMPFLSECKIIKPEKKEVESMDKNEELQKWLNDDRYVQFKDLLIILSMSANTARQFLKTRNIRHKKRLYMGGAVGGSIAFFDRLSCVAAKKEYDMHMQEVSDCLLNKSLTRFKDLSAMWALYPKDAWSLLRSHNIKPVTKFAPNYGGYTFYDRAECERARPFINQPEKEVEKVENIGELATATKHQILCETASDDFVWDKVTMKHKIMPVKNYCDERGNFVSLFKKDETVSAILEYKNEQKQLLEKCIADKNLVTTTELAKLWNTDKKGVYNKIYKLKIKPHVKVKLENGNIWHFYKKSDCIESQKVEKVEQVNLPEPKEQMPDIIPADTIDLFTMSELESELKQRGVELTAEVKAKINASDMPEMQEIATMIKGNAKTIAIRLSVLNEIAGQMQVAQKNSKKDILLLSKSERAVFEITRDTFRQNQSHMKQADITRNIQERYKLSYDCAKAAASRGISGLVSKEVVDRINDGFVLFSEKYLSHDVILKKPGQRDVPIPFELRKKTTTAEKLDFIISQLGEITELRKEVADLKKQLATR